MADTYSFIDVAVIEEVRERFAAGDAVAILDTRLGEVLWANGAGAALLGFPDIASALGADAALGAVTRRQIAACAGFPSPRRDTAIMLRIGGGMKGGTVTALLSGIAMPDGLPAVLLAVPAGSAEEGSTRAVSGLGREDGFFAAIVDARGSVESASPGFDHLAIDRNALRGLVGEVADEADRLVKRFVPAGDRRIPVGIARLTDDPALHLLIAVDEEPESDTDDHAGPVTETAGTPVDEPAVDSGDSGDNTNDEDATPDEPAAPTASQAADDAAAPIRFVWRTDAEGRFSAVSEEFAEAVGMPLWDIIGRHFRDVADELALDEDGSISALLERRDTWSGRSVLWPMRGSSLRVPVDLAALPVYSRERSFEGFRGFGVARMGDAAGAVPPAAARPPAEPERVPDEAPDNVVRLDPKAPEPARGLTQGEQVAFREIGARLRRDFEERAANAQDVSEAAPREAQDAGQLQADEPAPVAAKAVDDEVARTAPREETVAVTPSAFAPASSLAEVQEPAAEAPDTRLLAGLSQPVLIHSADVLHYANRAFLDLCGYAALDEIEAAGGLDALFAEPGEIGEGEGPLVLRTSDGRALPVDARLHALDWGDRRALMTSVTMRAVDPDGAARTELLERRLAEMRTIIDTATDGIVLIEDSGAIRSISRPAEALFGLDSEAVEGKPFTTLFAYESQRAAREYLNGLADNGVASVLNDGREVIGREAEGRFIPIFMTIGRLPDDGGFCAVLRDITQWKRAEEELTQARGVAERSSSQKTEFLARVSHEIRTPLNAIIGFSELMMDEKFGPIGSDRYRDYLRDINRSGNLVLELVNDLLDISKIEAGELELNYESVSLNEALAETVAMMQPQANRERVIIRSSLASRLPEVVADLRSVRQIALNLLSNALRYTPAGGQVVVSTSYEQSGDVTLRIRDTGIGMSLSEIDQALKPFKQINALKRGRNDGTGLGLPLTKAMVEANRARFAINSAPGEGTLVEIVFPSTRVLAE